MESLLTAGTRGQLQQKVCRDEATGCASRTIEADNEEGQEEWIGFGDVDEASSKEEGGEEGDGDLSEEELLHGLFRMTTKIPQTRRPNSLVSTFRNSNNRKDDKNRETKLGKAKRQPVVSLIRNLISFRVPTFLLRRRPRIGCDLPSRILTVPRGTNEGYLLSSGTSLDSDYHATKGSPTTHKSHIAAITDTNPFIAHLDGTLETLRFHRIDSARVAEIVAETMTITPDGSHPQMQSHPKSEGTPRAMGWSGQKFKKVLCEGLPRVSQQGSIDL